MTRLPRRRLMCGMRPPKRGWMPVTFKAHRVLRVRKVSPAMWVLLALRGRRESRVLLGLLALTAPLGLRVIPGLRVLRASKVCPVRIPRCLVLLVLMVQRVLPARLRCRLILRTPPRWAPMVWCIRLRLWLGVSC
jgi:hypothetical protein